MKLEVGRIYKLIPKMGTDTAYFKCVEEKDIEGVWYVISVFGGSVLELPAKWFDDWDIRISNKSEVLMNALDEW